MCFNVTINNRVFLWTNLELEEKLLSLLDAKVTDLWTDRKLPVVSEETIKILEHLRPQIEDLNKDSLNKLFKKCFAHLKGLALPFTQLTDDALEYILFLLPKNKIAQVRRVSKKFNSVIVERRKYLKITEKNITAIQFSKVIESFPYLLELDFSMNVYLTDEHLRHLKGKPLRSLIVNQPVTDKGLVYLRGMPLESLTLWGLRLLTDEGLKNLRGMPLRKLSLHSCIEIGNEGLKNLKGLPLQSLKLNWCQKITDEGLEYLKDMPLEELSLSCCRFITDAGLEHLRGMPLKSLILYGCSKITDAGLKALAGHSLQKFTLTDSVYVTDAGVEILKKMPLKELSLVRCPNISKIL